MKLDSLTALEEALAVRLDVANEDWIDKQIELAATIKQNIESSSPFDPSVIGLLIARIVEEERSGCGDEKTDITGYE